MDLLDERGAREFGHESDRVTHRGLTRRLIIQRERRHRMLVCRDVADERGLPNLPCTSDEDDPEIVESFDDQGADATGEEEGRGRHA